MSRKEKAGDRLLLRDMLRTRVAVLQGLLDDIKIELSALEMEMLTRGELEEGELS